MLQGEAERELHRVWVYILSTSAPYDDTLIKPSTQPAYTRQERDTIYRRDTRSTPKCRNTSIGHAVWYQLNSLIKFSTELVLIQILLKLELTAAPQDKGLLYTQV